MNSAHDFPSQQTERQQAFFQKSVQIDETYQGKEKQAQVDYDEQKRQMVSVLDFRLRRTALTSIPDAGNSIDKLIDVLVKNAQQVTNGLRERTTDLYKDKLAKAEKCKYSIQPGDKEQRLLSNWSTIDVDRLRVSFLEVRGRNFPNTLEDCAEQATRSLKDIVELGNPSRYGTGELGRPVGDVITDILNGVWFEIIAIFGLLFAQGFEAGCGASVVTAFILGGIAYGISDGMDIPFEISFLILIGIILSLGALVGGFRWSVSEEEKDAEQKARKNNHAKLVAGYSAYLIYNRAEDLMPKLYEEKVKLLDGQKESAFQDAANQEKEMMVSITRFKAELEQAQRQFRLKLQKIASDYQRVQETLKQEYQALRTELAQYSKLAIAAWNESFWQQGVAAAMIGNHQESSQRVGEIRIGRAVYPAENQRNINLPMLIDLERCGHIFIFSTPETAQQAKDLLKMIVARLAFAMPLMSAEFVFIDTEVDAVFAEYQKLPEKMGGRVPYSFEDEIQTQTRSLEQHQKRMQAKVGNGDLQTYNSTAQEPEMRRILCISGFPNPNRFRVEAQSHLENIVRSGARVGIHAVINVDTEASASNRDPRSIQELCSKYGVILQPLGNSGKWEACFNEKSIPFVPDTPPDSILMEPIMQQIRSQYEEKPVNQPLQVFLCHASEDKALVREVYQKLKDHNWIKPWLDEKEILPGQDWNLEIRKAIKNSGAVIVFLSNLSLNKEGYVHREIKKIMDMAEEKPEGTIFIIPLRLDECELPSSLSERQWENYFPLEKRDDALGRLLRALEVRYKKLSAK